MTPRPTCGLPSEPVTAWPSDALWGELAVDDTAKTELTAGRASSHDMD
jgi:hypothetical protein